MNGKNSKIFLAKNIKLDKNYKAVLNYSESSMLSLITNNSNLVYSALNYSFIRETNSIIVNAPYSVCVQANYMAFQNVDYSNKYFFAFIDDVVYKGENNTEIKYTIDVWTTWHDYWDAKACFVVREHVIDDTIGANTVPENLELGEYISCKSPSTAFNSPSDFYVVMAVSDYPTDDFELYNNHVYNGIFSGLLYLGFRASTGRTMAENCYNVIKMYDKAGKSDAIYGLFMIPKQYLVISGTGQNAHQYTWTYSGISAEVCYLDNSSSHQLYSNFVGSMPTTVGETYIPVNKKLFTFPYSYMNLTNNAGSSQQYFYEDFSVLDPDVPVPFIGFDIVSAISFGMSMKAIPIGYKNVSTNYDYGVIMGKLPVCSWNSDAFTNWLTQNSLNIVVSGVSSAISLVGGAMMMFNPATSFAGASATVNGLNGIIGTMGQIYQHSLTPNETNGNTNSGDINFSYSSDGGLTLYYMSIRDEYAKRIDQYFTRLGYKVNKVKIPNMSYRQNYNYVQVADEENLAYPNNHNNICLPAKALNEINNLFRKGITIWNNHNYFGDYSVTNNNTYTSE